MGVRNGVGVRGKKNQKKAWEVSKKLKKRKNTLLGVFFCSRSTEAKGNLLNLDLSNICSQFIFFDNPSDDHDDDGRDDRRQQL